MSLLRTRAKLKRCLITIDNSARSQNFPAVAALSDNDPTAPGGFVVGYMTETSNDDDRFTINFRVYDSSGSAVIKFLVLQNTTYLKPGQWMSNM